MDPRRGGYLLVRLYAALVVLGVLVVIAWLVYPSLLRTPDIAGIWFGLAGFVVLVVAMVLLIQASRD